MTATDRVFSRRALWLLAGFLMLTGCTSPVSRPASSPSSGDTPVSSASPSSAPASYPPAASTPSPAPSPAPTQTAAPAEPTPPPTPAYQDYGFVAVGDVIEGVLQEVRYYSSYNFVGERIDGYNAPVILLTAEAADALKIAADSLAEQGYVLKIFDGYRPQRAVEQFVRWAQDPADTRMKEYFYPDIDKSQLLNGYIARKSGHSRGSTVDLTLVSMATGVEADMGSPFDFLGEISHHGTSLVSQGQAANRLILKSAMEAAGFKAYNKEWWHYTLVGEPYPDTYFDFPIE